MTLLELFAGLWMTTVLESQTAKASSAE